MDSPTQTDEQAKQNMVDIPLQGGGESKISTMKSDSTGNNSSSRD